MKGLIVWWQRHPVVKTVLVGFAGVLLTAAAQGSFGERGAVVAGAIAAIYGLNLKRPQDTKGA